MNVPFVDLGLQHRQVAEGVAAAFAHVLDTTTFVGGPPVGEFEQAYASYAGCRHCVGVANGTDAVELALRASGVRAGDGVVLPANTFVATAEAVVRAGAVPVLVDCDPATHLIDVDQAAEAVRAGARAVVPVHLFGQLAPVDQLAEVVGDATIVVEDAAQSHGATRHGACRFVRSAAAATSFYPGKNLGAYGDGGAVVTDDADVADDVRAMGNHGGLERYRHDRLGWNSRLDTLQAAVLTEKLVRLDEWNAQRRCAADRYRELLAAEEAVELPTTLPGNEHVWHLFVVRVDDRDRVAAHLRRRGVATGIHYPTPVHLTGAFHDAGRGPGSHPVAEALAGRILSLPMFPGITEAQQDQVVDALLKAVRR